MLFLFKQERIIFLMKMKHNKKRIDLIDKKIKKYLTCFSCFLSIVFFSIPPMINGEKYDAASFVSDNKYGYTDCLFECYEKYFNEGHNLIIDNGIAIEMSSGCTYTIKNDETNEYVFELRFTSLSGKEFWAFKEKIYNKFYNKTDPTSKPFSYLIIGKQEFASAIYNPSKYTNYQDYDRYIECNYSQFKDKFNSREKFLSKDSFETSIKYFFRTGYQELKQRKCAKLLTDGLLFTIMIVLLFFSISQLFLKYICHVNLIHAYSSLLFLSSFICFLLLLTFPKLDYQIISIILIFIAFLLASVVSLFAEKKEDNYEKNN